MPVTLVGGAMWQGLGSDGEALRVFNDSQRAACCGTRAIDLPPLDQEINGGKINPSDWEHIVCFLMHFEDFLDPLEPNL